jgi:hypothetical protein
MLGGLRKYGCNTGRSLATCQSLGQQLSEYAEETIAPDPARASELEIA